MADRPTRRWLRTHRWAWVSPCYRALEHRFRIRTDDPSIAPYLAAAHAALADVEHDGGDLATYSLVDGGAPPARGRFRVFRDEELLGTLRRGHDALGLLAWRINRDVVESSTGRYLVLHAAAVTTSGGAVVLPAASGSGKTTLAAALVAAGFGYLTDESPGVDDNGFVHPYAKPLSLLPRSQALFPHLGPDEAAPLPARWAGQQWLVPPERIRRGSVGEPSPVAAVVLPRYDRTATTSLAPISTGEAVVELATNSFNWRDRPADHLRRLARAVSGVPAFRLTTNDLPAAVAAVEAAVGRRGAAA